MRTLRMVHFISGVLFGFLCSGQTKAAEISPMSEMPVAARQAVSIWNLNFKPFSLANYTNEVQGLFADLSREAPMRVIADYNGDSVDDYAILGEANNQQFLIVVLSGKKWRVVEVKKWTVQNFKVSQIPGIKEKANGVPFYIVKASGPLADNYFAKHKGEALQLEAYLGSVRLYSISGSRAREIK